MLYCVSYGPCVSYRYTMLTWTLCILQVCYVTWTLCILQIFYVDMDSVYPMDLLWFMNCVL